MYKDSSVGNSLRKSRLSNGAIVVEMKSNSEGVHWFNIEVRYCRRAAEPTVDRLANSWKELCGGSSVRLWGNVSGWRVCWNDILSRGEGAGVGGDAIGT
jgi:hypothetical protein